ncbi:MAG: FTR1 family protein [Acidobacteriota bacterium]
MARRIPFSTILLTGGAAAVAAVLVLQVLRTGGLPDPTGHGDYGARVLDIAVLVFREGLECILVLSAITANMVGTRRTFQRPVAAGAALAFVVTLITWRIAIGLIDSLAESVPALDVQAATGLLAILVLLLVMNWFFHKIYWAGWISLHSRRKQELLKDVASPRVWWGLALLGFTSLYREGFEVVLFLQSYRLKLGGTPVLYGVLIGLTLTTIVGVLTFVAHRRLPYRRMLVFTGVMLGLVLLVMVGEQAQEMQLARWVPTTPIAPLERVIPGWMGLWFAVFPTVETLAAQLVAAALVIGSFLLARPQARPSIAA